MALPIAALLAFASPIIEKLFPDPEKKAAAQLAIIEANQKGELAELNAAMSVIVAEAKSDHWIVAAWRPIIMLMFGFIVANNYIIYPYLILFFDDAPLMEIPPDLWQLIKIGLGGYVVGRSIEKTANVLKK